jgi:hypothetical protein
MQRAPDDHSINSQIIPIKFDKNFGALDKDIAPMTNYKVHSPKA